jgi:ribosomal protein S18 acetylase RimI-like enzyme
MQALDCATPPHDRPYQVTDRDACLSLFESNVPRFFHADERQDFIECLDASENTCFVVCDGCVVLGFGGFTLSDGGETANLCWGMVRRDQHGKGLGALLLRARLQTIATNTPARFVRLATSQHTADFYRRHGFEVQSVEKDGFAPGLDAVEMRLMLRPEPLKPLSG